MIFVVSKKTIAKENRPAFLAIAQEMITLTRKEAGCIDYNLTASETDENILVFVERWESRAHLDAHLNAPHFKALSPKYNALCQSGDLMILEDAYQLIQD